jgi:hypothetical protein
MMSCTNLHALIVSANKKVITRCNPSDFGFNNFESKHVSLYLTQPMHCVSMRNTQIQSFNILTYPYNYVQTLLYVFGITSCFTLIFWFTWLDLISVIFHGFLVPFAGQWHLEGMLVINFCLSGFLKTQWLKTILNMYYLLIFYGCEFRISCREVVAELELVESCLRQGSNGPAVVWNLDGSYTWLVWCFWLCVRGIHCFPV